MSPITPRRPAVSDMIPWTIVAIFALGYRNLAPNLLNSKARQTDWDLSLILSLSLLIVKDRRSKVVSLVERSEVAPGDSRG